MNEIQWEDSTNPKFVDEVGKTTQSVQTLELLEKYAQTYISRPHWTSSKAGVDWSFLGKTLISISAPLKALFHCLLFYSVMALSYSL